MFHSKYGEVSKICKESGQPVYITTDGNEELAVMDIRSFKRLQRTLHIRGKLLDALMKKVSKINFEEEELEGESLSF